MAAQLLPLERPMVVPQPLPPELQAKLKAPLPKEAIKPHPRLDGLSSINSAFIVERMNDVFGIGGYQEQYEKIDLSMREETVNKGTPEERVRKLWVATVHGKLTIPQYGIYLENFGGSDNEDPGDALKGACTDAFTKMCSHLGVGLDVYKSGRDGEGKDGLPPCPNCGKALRKSDREGEPEPFYCWAKKGGCGAKFSEEGLKAAQQRKASPAANPAQGAQQPSQAAADPGKTTIQAKVSKRVVDTQGKLWLMVGNYKCATMSPEFKAKLAKAEVGSQVELLVSSLTGQKGTIYQIHKVINVKPGGAL